jgi:hypothetical protein
MEDTTAWPCCPKDDREQRQHGGRGRGRAPALGGSWGGDHGKKKIGEEEGNGKERRRDVGAKLGASRTPHRFDRTSFDQTVQILSKGCANVGNCRCAVLHIYNIAG